MEKVKGDPVTAALRTAAQQLNQGRPKDALTAIDRALLVRPGFPPLLSLKAVALVNDGQGAAAVSQAKAAIAQASNWPDGLANLGYVLAELGRHEEAEASLRDALARQPAHEAAAMTLGRLLARNGRLGEAIELFESALSARPDHPGLAYNLAQAVAQSGDGERALALFKGLFQSNPNNADAANQAAALLLDMSRPQEALQLLDEALASRPDQGKLHNNRGTALRQLSRLDEAQQAYRQAVALQPRRAEPWRNLGLLAADLEQLEEASQALRQALALAPADSVARHMLDAVEGRTTPAPPDGFLAANFDAFAPGFERQLVERLEYSAPWTLADLGRRLRPEGRFAEALDIGCGTGLVARAFQDGVVRWTGVDLAPKMLEIARSSSLYHRLEQSEAAALLTRDPTRYDLAVAADLLIYLGEIGPLFSAVASRLEAGGLFLFSTERCRPEEGPCRLRPTGRYAQSDAHIEELAGAAGLTVVAREATVLRKQHGAAVDGSLFAVSASGNGDLAQSPPSQ